jgi:hypothetical protein
MGSIIDLESHRQRRSRPEVPRNSGDNLLTCAQCGERHPIIRLRGGELRCVTAFYDGQHWFCRNRGCRGAWLVGQQQR